ncbi:hypothetical protein TARUN_7051 [Trichoderma arundinaceum]|uniref:2EXR domain-containing protein n=1 Tax=Trichoderma arundinaceum TaxID=490622 RepID=A0A395NGE9_TRIAR|nr:hypothetical protein TARUN_7051 [Trichoderma arundinaceum]
MEGLPSEFTLFSRLPTELRIKIWESVPRPCRVIGALPPASDWYRHYFRAIGTRASSGGEDREAGFQQRYHYRYIVQPKKHAIFPPLQANREARSVWLPRFFQPSRHSRVADVNIRFDTPFISYDTDIFTVFDGWPSRGIPDDTLFNDLPAGHSNEPMDGFIALDRGQIRNIALCEISWNIKPFTNAIAIRELPNLKTLTIMALGPDASCEPKSLASQGSGGDIAYSLDVLEMLAVDIQRTTCEIHELPLELVHKSPFLNDARLRNPIILSPDIRPIFRYKTFMLSLLWHELRQNNAAEAISQSWWAYTDYLFKHKPEDDKCPLRLGGCGEHGHTKQEMAEWKPKFDINYKLLCPIEWQDELKHIGIIKA